MKRTQRIWTALRLAALTAAVTFGCQGLLGVEDGKAKATGADAGPASAGGATNAGATGAGGAIGPGGATSAGGVVVGAGGVVIGAGGVVVGAGGVVVGAGGVVVGAGGMVVGAGGVVAGAGGGVSVGGSTSASNLKITGSVTQCAGTTPAPATGSVAACILTGCTAAHCVPQAQLAAGTDTTLLAICSDGGFCTPDDYIATSGKFLPKTCKSLLGAEGRCISKCIPQVNAQLATLPPDVCAPAELCAPCFNPVDGTDTHACSQGCDTGAANKTPAVFAKCGSNLGVCVPPALVTSPSQQAALRAIDSADGKCANGTSVCEPVDKAKNQAYKFPSCTSTSLGYTVATALPSGQKAACVPYYLVPSGKLGLVDAGDCKQPAGAATGKGFICASCLDPTAGNASTGACD